MPFTTTEIAQLLAGEVVGDATAVLTGFAHADAAKPGDLTFAETDAYFAAAGKREGGNLSPTLVVHLRDLHLFRS